MEENKNKYTEKQWEDLIPKLYKKFGDTFVAKVKCTPKEYYAKMADTELVETLESHLREDVPIPEFLCAELEKRGETELLLPLLHSADESAAEYAFNLIGDDPRAYTTYFSLLTANGGTEELRTDITEVFKLHADEMKEKVLAAYREGCAQGYMLEIMSRVKARDDEVFDILMKAFLAADDTSLTSGYLAAYGDERALPALLRKIEDRSIGFVEFQELKYAIEALGGEYTEPRDFSADKDYLAIEAAAIKTAEENHRN
jgi:hypothetical protein